MLFYQVQIVMPRVEPNNRHMVAPLLDFEALPVRILWYVLRSYFGPNVFPRISTSSMNFRKSSFGLASQMCGGSCSRVSPTLRSVRACSRTCAESCLGTLRNRAAQHEGSFVLHLFVELQKCNVTRPGSDYVITSPSERSCSFQR